MSTPKNVPFRRVKDDEIEVSPQLANNSFDAKVNARKLTKEKLRSIADLMKDVYYPKPCNHR